MLFGEARLHRIDIRVEGGNCCRLRIRDYVEGTRREDKKTAKGESEPRIHSEYQV
jgi:hypothetical protein